MLTDDEFKAPTACRNGMIKPDRGEDMDPLTKKAVPLTRSVLTQAAQVIRQRNSATLHTGGLNMALNTLRRMGQASGIITSLLVGACFASPAAAQEPELVISGGRLIDGTSRAPIEDSVILIRGNRITAIGRRGEVQVPDTAQVFDASGKTILPGFIDGHCHLESFWGEVYLHLGVTTCVSIETQQNGPWALAQKYGTEIGKIRGPRMGDRTGARRAGRRVRSRGLAGLARLYQRAQRGGRARRRAAEKAGRLRGDQDHRVPRT